MIDSKFFIGVIEDINDPSERNRVRVRIFGVHTENIAEIPTEDLPWSSVMMSCSDASISGVGSTIGLVQGSWVIGIFTSPDEPIVLGSLPSESTLRSAQGEGFRDPSGIYPRESGNDTPRAARTLDYTQDTSYRSKESSHINDIPTASPPRLDTLIEHTEDYAKPKPYSMIPVSERIGPVYPYNQVKKSPSGHSHEVDDTEGAERISELHTSGTYREISADGSSTHVVKGSSYRVVFQNDNVYIQGACNITVDGEARTLIKGNYHLEVEGDYTQNIHGSYHTKALASLTEIETSQGTNIGTNRLVNIGTDDLKTVRNNCNIRIGDRYTTFTGDSTIFTAAGSHHITAAKASKISCSQKIHLNSHTFDCSGDVLAGGGNVSLITHTHPQNNGNDAGGGTNTSAGNSNTGVGS